MVSERGIKAWRYKVTLYCQCKSANNHRGKFENGFDEAGYHGGEVALTRLVLMLGDDSIYGIFVFV